MMMSPFQHYVMIQINAQGLWKHVSGGVDAPKELAELETMGLIKPHPTAEGVWVNAKENCKVPQNAMCGHYF